MGGGCHLAGSGVVITSTVIFQTDFPGNDFGVSRGWPKPDWLPSKAVIGICGTVLWRSLIHRERTKDSLCVLFSEDQ